MEKKTFRQMSLLGMLLMGASAITAAIVPSKSAPVQENSANNGIALANSGVGGSQTPPVYSCVAGSPADCHITASGTGALTVVVTALNHQYTTAGNTSLSNPLDGVDTTSARQRIN